MFINIRVLRLQYGLEIIFKELIKIYLKGII